MNGHVCHRLMLTCPGCNVGTLYVEYDREKPSAHCPGGYSITRLRATCECPLTEDELMKATLTTLAESDGQ